MAYADPQSVTVTGIGTVALPRVPSSNPARIGQFQSADGNMVLTVRQDTSAKRFRREIRLTQKKIAADPLTAVNQELSSSVIIVVDEPRSGFSDAELLNLWTGLTALLTASTNAKFNQALGGEL